jgi:hypothetical protein
VKSAFALKAGIMHQALSVKNSKLSFLGKSDET